MKKYNKDIGTYGEYLAQIYLKRRKFTLLKCNYRCPLGEIDIICKKDNLICFVEVKSRFYLNYGMPYDAVNFIKRRKIKRISEWYISENNLNNFNFRFDVISVYFFKDNKYHIELIENAF